MPDPTGYQSVAEIKGDGQFNTVFFYARPTYRDYMGNTGTNVLFNITVPISVAAFYAERCEETDVCDVGTTNDNDVDSHSPGICVYPAEWDSVSTANGYTVRVAQSGGANMYVNFDDADRLYCVELTYKASSNLNFRQYTNDGYKTLATLTGDSTIRKVIVPLDRDYRDYNGADSNGLINVLFEFSGALTLYDAAVTGDGI